MIEEPCEKHNVARQRSIAKIITALFALLKEKRFSEITVTDICNSAGLVRKTFYRIFPTKTAALEYRIDCMFYDFSSKCDYVNMRTRDMFTFCFEYFAKEREFISVFTDPDLYGIVIEKIRDYISIVLVDTLHNAVSFEPAFMDYYYNFIAVGLCSIIRTWVQGGCKQSPQVMANITERLLSGVVV